MQTNNGDVIPLLVVLFFMIIGAAFMIGGPNMAGKFINWLLNMAINLLKSLIALPFRILFPSVFGKRKKKRKKKVSWFF